MKANSVYLLQQITLKIKIKQEKQKNIKFESLDQYMIDKGANPHIIEPNTSEQNYDTLDISKLKNVPKVKSVFYPIKKFANCKLGNPWTYTTGVFDGKYERVIGHGGEATVIKGVWNRQPAAYKFVEIKGLTFIEGFDECLNEMSYRLKEMTEIMSTPGDKIVKFHAHYR